MGRSLADLLQSMYMRVAVLWSIRSDCWQMATSNLSFCATAVAPVPATQAGAAGQQAFPNGSFWMRLSRTVWFVVLRFRGGCGGVLLGVATVLICRRCLVGRRVALIRWRFWIGDVAFVFV